MRLKVQLMGKWFQKNKTQLEGLTAWYWDCDHCFRWFLSLQFVIESCDSQDEKNNKSAIISTLPPELLSFPAQQGKSLILDDAGITDCLTWGNNLHHWMSFLLAVLVAPLLRNWSETSWTNSSGAAWWHWSPRHPWRPNTCASSWQGRYESTLWPKWPTVTSPTLAFMYLGFVQGHTNILLAILSICFLQIWYVFLTLLDPVKHTLTYLVGGNLLPLPGCAQPWHYPGETFCNFWIGVTAFWSFRVNDEIVLRKLYRHSVLHLFGPIELVMGVDN